MSKGPSFFQHLSSDPPPKPLPSPPPFAPSSLCPILERLGIYAGRWRADQLTSSYYCLAAGVTVGPPHPALDMVQNLIYYSVYSRADDVYRLKYVKIDARFYTALSKTAVKQKAIDGAATIVRHLRMGDPGKILSAMREERTTMGEQGVYSFEVEKDCGPELPFDNRMCWVSLTVRPR